MVQYNPKDWFTFIFRFHRADTVRQLLPMIVAISLYSWGVALLEIHVLQLSDNSHVKNIPVMHGLLGFVISMLLVFRTNTAYDRWWEGRKLWGSLVNHSRNFAMKLNALLPASDTNERSYFREAIPRYAETLSHHLCPSKPNSHPGEELDPTQHAPNQLANAMMQRVVGWQQQGKITPEQLLFLQPDLQHFTDVCGACERIKNTPIPFSYSVFLKKFIFVYTMTLPFGYVFSLGYYVIPVVAFVFYVLASLELIAEEIEEPFGHDANDIPTELIAANIRKHVGELLQCPKDC